MNKALAVLRTVFLVFIVGYTVRGMPWVFGLPQDTAEGYNVCRHSLGIVTRAAWIAIGWVALETLIGWLVATRNGPRKPAPAAAPGAPPP